MKISTQISICKEMYFSFRNIKYEVSKRPYYNAFKHFFGTTDGYIKMEIGKPL
jgi:hypothetical protein